MAGDIYFGINAHFQRGRAYNDGYTNTESFQAFGELLTAALSENCAEQLAQIKESEAMRIYDFCFLTAPDYNRVIRTLRHYIAALSNPTDEQRRGMLIWHGMAEPFIRKDKRYDFAFHGEELPTTPA